MFPKKAFITFINEHYKPLVDRLIQSIEMFSEYKIIVYSYNFDYITDSKQTIVKRIDDYNLKVPVFSGVDVENGNLGIVERGDYNTYYTLSRKPSVILDALNNGLEEGIFLDADGLVRENIDEAFDFLNNCEDYPLVGKGLFEYMMLYGKGDPAVGDPLEMPMMNFLGVYHRSMHYVQTNFMVFNKRCVSFFEECIKVSNNKNILDHNLLYAPYHDETIINVLLWKRNAKKHLPLIHFNLIDSLVLKNFYKKDFHGKVNDSSWHIIPENKNDIKYFHGCKTISELDKCIDFFKLNKNDNRQIKFIKNNQENKDKKICIVTLYDKNYNDLANLSIPNKLDYAKKHGYDVIYFNDILDKDRPAQWSKVKAIEYALKQNYDWVWWIDIDALIMEFDIMLESIIDNNFDIIFTSNKYSYLSNGSSFFKNSKLTFDFLSDCYNLELDCLKNVNINIFDHEQQSMRELLLNEEKYKNKIKLIDERCCNSYCLTENKEVLSAYPNWNNESNIYQKGDFVIQFCGRNFSERLKDFEFYQKYINYGNKNITIIDCFADSDSKLEILRECINKVKKNNNHILLVSHCTLPPDIISQVNYFIYDKENTFNEKNIYLTWYKYYNEFDIEINVSTPGILPQCKSHEFPIIKSMRNAFNFIKSLHYENFFFLEFDNLFEQIELNRIKKIQSDTLFLKKQISFFTEIYQNEMCYHTLFFTGKTSFMVKLLNDFNKIPNKLSEFNSFFTWSYPFTLEHIFARVIKPIENECLLLNEDRNIYFNMNTKNLCNYIDVDSYIVPDQYNKHHIIVSNPNTFDVQIKIKFEENILFDSIINQRMLPSIKLKNEGVYSISFFDKNGVCFKTKNESYSKSEFQLYKNRGRIKFKNLNNNNNIILCTGADDTYLEVPHFKNYLDTISINSNFDKNILVYLGENNIKSKHKNIEVFTVDPKSIKKKNINNCIQHGEFLNSNSFNTISDNDVIVYTDGDIILQRKLKDSEINFLRNLENDDIFVGYNASPTDTLYDEYLRLNPIDIDYTKYFEEDLKNIKVYNTGVLCMNKKTWLKLKEYYIQDYDQISNLFSHYAKQQWFLCFLFKKYNFNVIEMNYDLHCHPYYGYPPNVYKENNIIKYKGETILFNHKWFCFN